METIRQRNLAHLTRLGFRVANSLPTKRYAGPTVMRPPTDVASRLLAMGGVFLWVTDWGEEIPSPELKSFLSRGGLASFLTSTDQAILQLTREQARQAHSFNIGWRLENMWALAWVLGFEPVPVLQGFIDHRTIEALLRFLAIPDDGAAELLARANIRPLSEIDEAEDLFYCAHNAARSAQLGRDTVPGGFHPLADGGGIHERRHSLSWVLSPGTDWDNTDLST